MTLQTVIDYVRAQVQTDANGLTDTKAIIFANEANADFHRRLVNAGVDASQTQESYTSGTANQGTYLYPTDMLFLKAIELNYADTNTQNYQVANQIDVSNIAGGNSFSWLRLNANKYSPQFDDRGDQYEIFPTPTSADNVTNLIRIFYFLKPTLYTALSDTVAYPESMDATILGWRIAGDYLYSLGQNVGRKGVFTGDFFYAKYDERVKQYIATLSRGVQQPIQATPIQLNGFEF